MSLAWNRDRENVWKCEACPWVQIFVETLTFQRLVLNELVPDNPELFKEILNDFIVPTWNIINAIKTGWENHSAEEIEMSAHKLKSSAKSVGAIELGDICSILEIAGKKQDWATIDPLIPRLDPVMNDVEQYIKNL